MLVRIPGSTRLATGTVTATNAAAVLVAANIARERCTVKNNDSTNTIYIGSSSLTGSTNGLQIVAGESFSFSYVGDVWVIAPTANCVVSYFDELH